MNVCHLIVSVCDKINEGNTIKISIHVVKRNVLSIEI